MNDQTVSSSSAPARGHGDRARPAARRHSVTLLDSAEPGRAPPYGNAGFIAIDHVLRSPRRRNPEARCRSAEGPQRPAHRAYAQPPLAAAWMARFARAPTARPRSGKASMPSRS